MKILCKIVLSTLKGDAFSFLMGNEIVICIKLDEIHWSGTLYPLNTARLGEDASALI